jgi:two-component system chemotaxis response regulator CheY
MKSKAEETPTEPRFSFMVVDDSKFACRNMERMMVAMGGKPVGFASNGREAVEQYPKLRPDLVLMDINMPEMEGIEAVEGILAQDTSAKVVMVSSMGYQDMIKKALVSGAKHFLVKPVKPEQAASVVNFVLKEN